MRVLISLQELHTVYSKLHQEHNQLGEVVKLLNEWKFNASWRVHIFFFIESAFFLFAVNILRKVWDYFIVEYTDNICPTSVLDMTLNNLMVKLR